MPSDSSSTGGFGSSVAISGDTAVIGAFSAVYVFTRTNGVWTQGQKLTSGKFGQDYFGASVAISGDTIAVRAPWTDPDYSGTAHIFVRTNGVWTQQQKLTGSNTAKYDAFGHSVAISGDTIVVGAYAAPSWTFIGAAYVFVRTNGVWSQQQKLTASDAAHSSKVTVAARSMAAVARSGQIRPDGAGLHEASQNVASAGQHKSATCC